MTDDPLAPQVVAACIAPVLDRLRIGIADRIRAAAGPLVTGLAVDPAHLGVTAMLRNTMPDRVVTRAQLAAVFTYQPPEQVARGIDEIVAAGIVHEPDEGTLQLADRGREILAVLHDLAASVVSELWAAHEDRADGLAPLAERVVDAAGATGGDAFAVVAPVHEPPDASPALLLAERLTPLRFHRFDAHIAAWRAAGLTAAEVTALGDGSQRRAIEAETNRLAAAPYAVLEPAERFALVSGLGALPS